MTSNQQTAGIAIKLVHCFYALQTIHSTTTTSNKQSDFCATKIDSKSAVKQ